MQSPIPAVATKSITDAVVKKAIGTNDCSAFCAAWVAYWSFFREKQDPKTMSAAVALAANSDPDCELFLADSLRMLEWEDIQRLAQELGETNLEGYLNGCFASMGDSSLLGSADLEVSVLILKLLGLKPGERFVEYRAKAGGLMQLMADHLKGVRALCTEESIDAYARLHASDMFYSDGTEWYHGDAFSAFEHKDEAGRADAAFAVAPFGANSKLEAEKSPYARKLLESLGTSGRPVSVEWLYNRLLIDSISENGRAIGFLSGAATSKNADEAARKLFVENGWIRAIVALPAWCFGRMFKSQMHLVVLCHDNGGSIRVVDATDLRSDAGRKAPEIEQPVQAILERLSSDSDRSRAFSTSELAERRYELTADKLLHREREVPCGVEFNTVIENLTRGASLKSAELDDLQCTEATHIGYLFPSNISDGCICGELVQLTALDSRLEKYRVQTGDLLISKNGLPVKTAVAEVPDGQTIVASENLYVVRVRRDEADPYYLAAFLASEAGRDALKQASSTGGAVTNISAAMLKSLTVPHEDIDCQHRIGAAYRASLHEIAEIKAELASACEFATRIFDETSRG